MVRFARSFRFGFKQSFFSSSHLDLARLNLDRFFLIFFLHDCLDLTILKLYLFQTSTLVDYILQWFEMTTNGTTNRLYKLVDKKNVFIF